MMNHRLYAAAGGLSESERKRDRGAFWRSIHGTLSHLLWGDLAWMARLDGGDPPVAAINDSLEAFADFEPMAAGRGDLDAASRPGRPAFPTIGSGRT